MSDRVSVLCVLELLEFGGDAQTMKKMMSNTGGGGRVEQESDAELAYRLQREEEQEYRRDKLQQEVSAKLAKELTSRFAAADNPATSSPPPEWRTNLVGREKNLAISPFPIPLRPCRDSRCCRVTD